MKINEWKDEIRSLIDNLKAAQNLVMSNFSIFKSYIHEKLIQEKEEESKWKRDFKHSIRLKLLDDQDFYNLLWRNYKIKNIKKKNEFKQIKKR